MKNTTKTFETDWLNSDPVFYNEKTGQSSKNINDLIDIANFEFDAEGFNNYLEFGYSVFGQTPIRHIKFLSHSSKITNYDDGSFTVEKAKEDPVDQFFGKQTNVENVVELTRNLVNQWEDENPGDLLVPLSGGYDSRMLAMLVRDKHRAKSFTFGLSANQEDSFEVIYAKEMSRVMGMQWDTIKLGNFHKFFDEWDKMYGVSVHAHGMYHMEFYSNLIAKVNKTMPMISGGLNGSIWAGEITIPEISSPDNLAKLAHSHGLSADKSFSLLKSNSNYREKFWEENSYNLKNLFYRLIWSCRMKNILLHYVLKVPQSFGFTTCAPYNNINVALGMLNLPPEQWKNRLWQIDLFRKNNIFVEDYIKKVAKENILDLRALNNIKPKELDSRLLSQCIDPKYVDWINETMSTHLVKKAVKRTSKIKFFRKKKEKLRDKIIKAYNAYLTLRPIQNLLEKRESLK